MAAQTATDYGSYPPRTVHVGVNRMHANVIATLTESASDAWTFFNIPPDCMVVSASIKASAPSGATGQTIFKIGVPGTDNLFATITMSNSLGLATRISTIVSPITVSSSGTDGQVPVVVTVNTAVSGTTSLSVYLLLEYVMPGNIN